MRISSLALLSGMLCLPTLAATPPSSKGGQEKLTLEQAFDLALATDQSIRIAFLEVQKADLLPLSALTRVGPRLNGSVGYVRSGTDTELAGASNVTRNRRGAGVETLSLDQPLVDLSVFPARRRGKLQAESARLERQFTIRETLFGVASAYYEVLKQERLLDVNRQALELAKQQGELAQKRLNVGEVTRSDVLTAQVSVETARRGLIASENTLELQRNTLRNILNFAPSASLRLVEPEPYRTNKQSFESLLQKAWAQREDLRDRALSVRIAEENRKEILTKYAPSVVASLDQSHTQASGFSAGKTNTWSAGVSVQVPIFTGGQREIDLATAKLATAEAILNKDQLGKSIEGQVKQAWLNVRSLDSSLAAVKVQIEAAEQSYSDLQNQYSAGIAKSVDVLSALKDLNSARSDFATITFDYQVALRAMEQMVGTFQESRVQRSTVK